MSMGMRDSLRFVLREQFARVKFFGVLIGGAFAIMVGTLVVAGAIMAFVSVPKSVASWIPLIWLGTAALLIQLWRMTYLHSRSHSH